MCHQTIIIKIKEKLGKNTRIKYFWKHFSKYYKLQSIYVTPVHNQFIPKTQNLLKRPAFIDLHIIYYCTTVVVEIY